VVKKRIVASSTLIKIRINTVEKSTEIPNGILIIAANAIGSVLKGLKTIPNAGKNTGADWNMTAIVVNTPPILMKWLLFIFSNFNTSIVLLNFQ